MEKSLGTGDVDGQWEGWNRTVRTLSVPTLSQRQRSQPQSSPPFVAFTGPPIILCAERITRTGGAECAESYRRAPVEQREAGEDHRRRGLERLEAEDDK